MLLELDDDFTIQNLRNSLEGKPNGRESIKFKEYSDEVIQQMMDVKRTGNALVYQTGVNRLISYCGKDLTFDELDYKLLDGFIHHLKASGLKQNSIGNYLRSIRAIYNKAIKSKLVDRSHYPFHNISIKTERTAKRAISRDDIKRMNNLPLVANTAPWRALNYFMLSFYLRGMSFVDMAYLKPSNLVDGRINYKRRKTHKNYSVRLFAPGKYIINQLKREGSDYLLPILSNSIEEDNKEANTIIRNWIRNTNKYLKRFAEEIECPAPITTYTSRHTFATTAKRMGYSNELIAEALGHEYGNRITNIYLDVFDNDALDRMHHEVISL